MTLKADHSDLPRRSHGEGLTPDAEARFGPLVAERWQAADKAKGELPRASQDARFRHSDALKCSRAISYAALDLEPSDPMDLPGYMNVTLGSWVHEQWQEALVERFGDDAEVEVKVASGERAGHIDAVVRIVCDQCGGTGCLGNPVDSDYQNLECPACDFRPIHTIAIEAKTVGGTGFKMAVGERSKAKGPNASHIAQAALNGAEVDADEVVVVYWAKDGISVGAAQRKGLQAFRYTAEWTFPRDVYEPIAKAEQARVDGILALLDGGKLAARKVPLEMPPGAEIVDPNTGAWEVKDGDQIVDVGSYFMCNGYCRYQGLCAKTDPGRIPVTAVTIGAKP